VTDLEKHEGGGKKIPLSPLSIHRQLLIVALMAGLTVLLTRPLQISLLARMGEFQDKLAERAGEFLGFRIAYGSMAPSVFGTLDIRDILVSGEEGTPLLSLKRLRISWSPLALLRGREKEALRSVRLDRPILTMGGGEAAALRARFSPARRDGEGRAGGSLPPEIASLVPDNFRILIRNGEWRGNAGGGQLSLRRLGLDAVLHRGAITFRGRWEGEGRFLEEGRFAAGMSGRARGELSAGLEWGNALVWIPRLEGDQISLKPLRIRAAFADRKVSLEKVEDGTPLDFGLDYDFRERRLSAGIRMDQFSPGNLMTLRGAWKDYDPWVSLALSGTLSVEKTGTEPPGYSVDLEGNFPSRLPARTPTPLLLANGALTVKGRGRADRIDIENLDFKSPGGNFYFRGGLGFKPLSPEGNLVIRDLALRNPKSGAVQRISTALEFRARGREVGLSGETLSIGPVVFLNPSASLLWEPGGFSFRVSALSLREKDSPGGGGPGSLSLEGSMDYRPRHIQANLSLDSLSVRDAADLAVSFGSLSPLNDTIRGFIDYSSISAELFFTTDFEHILYNATSLRIVYGGTRNIVFSASFSGTDHRIALDEGLLAWREGSADITGFADFSNPGDISFVLGASWEDFSYYLEGMILDRRSLSVRGSYGLQGYFSLTGTGGYSGYIEGESIPIPSGGQYALLSLRSNFRYDSPEWWSGSLDKLEITNLVTPGSNYSVLRVAGTGDQNGLFLPDLYFEDGRGILQGNLSVTWNRDYSGYLVRVFMQNEGGMESYNLEANYSDRFLDAHLIGREMQFARFSAKAHNSIASGDLRLHGSSVENFRADIVLESLSARYRESEFRASLSASLSNNEFFLKDFKGSYRDLEASMPYLYLDRRGGHSAAEAWIQGSVNNRKVYLSFDADCTFTPTKNWFAIREGFRSFKGSVNVENAWYEDLYNKDPFGFDFTLTETAGDFLLSLSGGPRNMIRFRYSGGGDFYAALSGPSPVRGSIIGTITPKTIDAHSTDLYVDLGSLWRFIPPQDNMHLTGGFATAEIHVSGSLRDPEFNGSVQTTSVRITVPQYLREEIRPVPFGASIRDSEINFGPVECALGNGSGLVSAWFRFDRWVPNIFNMDIQIPPEHSVPVAFDLNGIIVEGQAAGALNLSMADLIFNVSGAITTHDTVINLDNREIMAAAGVTRAINKVNTLVDISVTTGRKVEFLWPMTRFPVLQAYADLGSGLRITNDTFSRRFTIQGDVKLRSGEIFYFERSFYIREGTLVFNENEIHFDPRISARAEIRDRSDDGPVTIAMIIDNAPLSSFTARLESNPPLSQVEIFSILGQNLTGSSEGDGDRNRFLSATTDALTQFAVVRQIQRKIRDFLGLDMFSIRTQVLQNMVFQAAGLQEPVDRMNRVGNYFDNTAVFFGKYLGSDLFIQSTIFFRYDKTRETWGGLRLEPEIGLEMRNPLFDIRFNVMPLHPENWFMNDISFTLTWRHSF
jgi:hypothetical protein